MVNLFPFIDPTTNSYRIWPEGGRLRGRQVGQSWGDQDWDKEGMAAYNPVTKWEGLDPNSLSRGECLLWLMRGYACWFKRYWGQGCGKVSGGQTRREKLLQQWRRKERNLLSLKPQPTHALTHPIHPWNSRQLLPSTHYQQKLAAAVAVGRGKDIQDPVPDSEEV